jgi:hypothetical protein
MKLILPLVLLFLSLSASAQVTDAAAKSKYTEIAFDWSYTPNLPICGKTLKSCFVGFTIHNMLNDAITTLPASARSWNYFPKDGVQYGKHTFHLYALGYDVNGAEVHSTAAQIVINVVPPPSVATSFTGVLQQ